MAARLASLAIEVTCVLNQQSRVESARLFGGVEYLDDTPDRKARGESQEATAAFDGKGRTAARGAEWKSSFA